MKSDMLVSIGLPIRNGERSVADVARSVLAQDHENLEFIIADNASTDGTEEICRELAAADARIRYIRRPANIGLVPNFLGALALAEGTWFRWIGDGDQIDTCYVSRCLDVVDDDPRLILVSTQIDYELEDGSTVSGDYRRTELRSADPTVRFAEMLRLLTSGFVDIDPLYGLVRRDPVGRIHYRRMLRGDEVYAARIALAGPWGHVPEVLAHRGWERASPSHIAARLGVPAWRAPIASEVQCFELMRAVQQTRLSSEQRRRAQAAVGRLYWKRTINAAGRAVRRLGSSPGNAAMGMSVRSNPHSAARAEGR